MVLRIYPLIVVLLFNSAAIANIPLSFDTSDGLYEHLYEVNEQWAVQSYDLSQLNTCFQFENESDRIQMHLLLVEQVLRNRSNEAWTTEQIKRRNLFLDFLYEYAKAGQFPQNTHHSIRIPYFVDDAGTHCAVGYLLHKANEHKLVQQIRSSHNYSYLKDMPYTEITAWADQNGFTFEELEWIQPGYPPAPKPFTAMGNGLGVTGMVHVMEKNEEETMLYLAGDFTAVDGVEANNIVAWDGETFLPMGGGLNGVVHTMEFIQGKLYVGGEFTMADFPDAKNIAVWDGNEWESIATGEMEGAVYDIIQIYEDNNEIYFGGAFKKINGQELPYLASYHIASQTWTNSAFGTVDGEWQEINGAMAVDGPVYCLEKVGYNLLVGGDFMLTAPDVPESTINQLDAHYLAYWDGYNWVGALYGSHPPVTALRYHNGDLFVGGDLNAIPGFQILKAGIWMDYNTGGEQAGFFPEYDGVIHDFVAIDDYLVAVGGFFFSGWSFTFGGSAAIFYDGLQAEGYAIFDNNVRAAIEFQGAYIFAGDFELVGDTEIKHLAKLDAVSPIVSPITDLGVNVFASSYELNISYDQLPDDGQLRLYSLAGQEIGAFQLPKGQFQGTFDISHLPAGAYVYHIVSDGRRTTGKIVK